MHIHVVGAGVVGLTTAYYLTKKGHKVTILEKEDSVAKGSSFANGGQLSYCFSDPLGKPNLIPKFLGIALNRDPAIKFNLPKSAESFRWLINFASNCRPELHKNNQIALAKLSLASKSLFHDLQDHLNFKFDHHKSSKIALFEKEEDFQYEKNSLETKSLFGNDNVALTLKEAKLKEPGIKDLNRNYAGAIFSESDEAGDTYLFCMALKEWLEDKGTDFLFDTEIKSIVKNRNKIEGLNTNKGLVSTSKIIICAGTFTTKIIKSPQLITPAKGYSLTLPRGKIDFNTSLTLSDQKILFTKLGNKVRITGFADFFSTPKNDKKRLRDLLEIAQDIAPDFADYSSSLNDSWSGDRPLTPSSLPFIGPSNIDGVFINSGHGFYGWTLSFASGEKISTYF